uniref:Uncharacterized protein n=1 Tax=Spongospora subterranea TaxID=70186 RepID=A0A0H5QVR5_9EUKA|eukprot:CRZ05817.1 hypothetical protein [Spongospora subterranea]
MSISRNDIPGVGSYDIQPQSSFKTASDVKLRRATLGIKHSPPFQNTEQRFGTISRQEVPGPGSYDPDRRNVIDPELEEYKKSKRTGFGVGSERFAAPKQNSTPSPGSVELV